MKYFILIWLFLSNIHDFALKFEIGVCDTCISVHIVKKNRKNVQKYFFFAFDKYQHVTHVFTYIYNGLFNYLYTNFISVA